MCGLDVDIFDTACALESVSDSKTKAVSRYRGGVQGRTAVVNSKSFLHCIWRAYCNFHNRVSNAKNQSNTTADTSLGVSTLALPEFLKDQTAKWAQVFTPFNAHSASVRTASSPAPVSSSCAGGSAGSDSSGSNAWSDRTEMVLPSLFSSNAMPNPLFECGSVPFRDREDAKTGGTAGSTDVGKMVTAQQHSSGTDANTKPPFSCIGEQKHLSW